MNLLKKKFLISIAVFSSGCPYMQRLMNFLKQESAVVTLGTTAMSTKWRKVTKHYITK